MAGTSPTINSSMVGATATADPAAAAVGASGSVRPSAQVLSDLMGTLTTLLATEVTAENQAERNAEIAKLREQMTKAQEDINADNARLATYRLRTMLSQGARKQRLGV